MQNDSDLVFASKIKRLVRAIERGHWCQSSDAETKDGHPCDPIDPMSFSFDVVTHADMCGLDDSDLARIAKVISPKSSRIPISILRDWNDSAGMTKKDILGVLRMVMES